MAAQIIVNSWCLEGFVLRGEMTFADVVQAIAAMDVHGIDVNEIYMGLSPHPDPSRLFAIKDLCSAAALDITSCWFWADMLGGAVMESEDAVVAHMQRFLATTRILGGKYLTVHNGTLPRGMSVDEGRAILLRLYGRLAPLAEAHGVVIGIEAPRASAPFNSPRGALDLVKEFDSPFVTLTPDFECWRRPSEKMPMRYAEDPDSIQAEPLPVDLLAECLPYSPFLHVKFLEFDESGSDPNYPLREMFAAIRQGGGTHDILIEYEGWIPDIHPERDALAETRRAVEFVRTELG